MITTKSRSLWQFLATLATAGLLAACTDDGSTASYTPSASLSPRAFLTAPEAAAASAGRLPALGACEPDIHVPEGSKVSLHVFGKGVQIYRWDGAQWLFVNPSADLFADAVGAGLVGTHFGTPQGPNWLTVSGSRVVGTVTGRCTPSPDAIAWLRLDATADGSGVFEKTAFIQRLNTVGGLAPSAPGSVVGQEASVPYTADYYFYRAP